MKQCLGTMETYDSTLFAQTPYFCISTFLSCSLWYSRGYWLAALFFLWLPTLCLLFTDGFHYLIASAFSLWVSHPSCCSTFRHPKKEDLFGSVITQWHMPLMFRVLDLGPLSVSRTDWRWLSVQEEKAGLSSHLLLPLGKSLLLVIWWSLDLSICTDIWMSRDQGYCSNYMYPLRYWGKQPNGISLVNQCATCGPLTGSWDIQVSLDIIKRNWKEESKSGVGKFEILSNGQPVTLKLRSKYSLAQAYLHICNFLSLQQKVF